MKKVLFGFLSVVAIFCFGCQSSNLSYIKSNLQETCEKFLTCKTDAYYAYLYFGQRMEDGSLKDYSLLKIVLTSGATYSSISATLVCDEVSHLVQLDYLSTDGNFYAELVDVDKTVQNVEITCLLQTENFDVMFDENTITLDECLQIACEKFDTKISACRSQNQTIKFYTYALVSAEFDNIYVGVVMVCNGTSYGATINPNTKKIEYSDLS